MSTTVDQQEAQTRREYLRKDAFERINPNSKTDEEKQQGKLDRAQLYLFLTEMAVKISKGVVLLSRMTGRHFWCQTGFVIENNVVYGKYGDSPYQPIGWDTGTEYYPLDIAKLLWKHEFSWFDPSHPQLAAEAPWEVTITEVTREEVDDPDGSALTDKERALFEKIMTDLKEELDWVPPKDWKRAESFEPKTPKRKYQPAQIMERVTVYVQEREEDFLKEADKRIESITEHTAYKAMYEDLVQGGGIEADEDGEVADYDTWLRSHIAEGLATDESTKYAKSLQSETEPYTFEELDELAKKAELEFRVRETVKMAAMNSPRIDRKIEKIIEDNPTIGADLEHIDILSFAAQTLDWLRMRLDEDESSRIVEGTTVAPRISFDQIREVEGKTAGYLHPELVRIRDAIIAVGGLDKLEDDDQLVFEANAVAAQTMAALPGVAKVLEPLVDEALLDAVLDKILEYFDEKDYVPTAKAE